MPETDGEERSASAAPRKCLMKFSAPQSLLPINDARKIKISAFRRINFVNSLSNNVECIIFLGICFKSVFRRSKFEANEKFSGVQKLKSIYSMLRCLNKSLALNSSQLFCHAFSGTASHLSTYPFQTRRCGNGKRKFNSVVVKKECLSSARWGWEAETIRTALRGVEKFMFSLLNLWQQSLRTTEGGSSEIKERNATNKNINKYIKYAVCA